MGLTDVYAMTMHRYRSNEYLHILEPSRTEDPYTVKAWLRDH